MIENTIQMSCKNEGADAKHGSNEENIQSAE